MFFVLCYLLNSPLGGAKKIVVYKPKSFTNRFLPCSPTIEAGVGYDKEYFNTCMGYMPNNSTSSRAFSQMLHRVRNLKDEYPERDLKLPRTADTILIYIGDLYYSEIIFLLAPHTSGPRDVPRCGALSLLQKDAALQGGSSRNRCRLNVKLRDLRDWWWWCVFSYC